MAEVVLSQTNKALTLAQRKHVRDSEETKTKHLGRIEKVCLFLNFHPFFFSSPLFVRFLYLTNIFGPKATGVSGWTYDFEGDIAAFGNALEECMLHFHSSLPLPSPVFSQFLSHLLLNSSQREFWRNIELCILGQYCFPLRERNEGQHGEGKRSRCPPCQTNPLPSFDRETSREQAPSGKHSEWKAVCELCSCFLVE
jgi:hypothetical protein